MPTSPPNTSKGVPAIAPPRPARIPEAGPSRPRPTPAEAYAHANYPSRRHPNHGNVGGAVGKPIFDWISRKLGGGGRRGTIVDITPRPRGVSTSPISPTELSTFTRDSRSELHSLRSYSLAPVSEHRREINNPYPSLPTPQLHRESTIDTSYLSRTSSVRSEGSLTSSLRPRISFADDGSFRLAGRADEDASLRPLPPSHQASPTPSANRSASLVAPRDPGSGEQSYASSENGPSRRDSASTKPTTIVSVEGVAHIAQVPSPVISIPSSPLRESISSPATPISPPTLIQAPKHSHPHPRDNPHPSSPPDPNASTLTLASSTAAIPGSWTPNAPSLRPSSLHQPHLSTSNSLAPSGASPISTPLAPIHRPASIITSPSVTWAPGPDRNSEYQQSLHPATSLRNTGWARAADRDASVRAVRRKGSWESNESGWSWRGVNGNASPGFVSPALHHSSSGLARTESTPRLSLLAPPLDIEDGLGDGLATLTHRNSGTLFTLENYPRSPLPEDQASLHTGIAA